MTREEMLNKKADELGYQCVIKLKKGKYVLCKGQQEYLNICMSNQHIDDITGVRSFEEMIEYLSELAIEQQEEREQAERQYKEMLEDEKEFFDF